MNAVSRNPGPTTAKTTQLMVDLQQRRSHEARRTNACGEVIPQMREKTGFNTPSFEGCEQRTAGEMVVMRRESFRINPNNETEQ